jgi:hypothetical protein
MQERTHTIRRGVNLMPWQIEAGDGLNQRCILVAVMNGNEMQSVSLHVAEQPKRDD